MTEDELDNVTVIPFPASETEEERRRIRDSNARDQQLEREGKTARHNAGYDEVADLKPAPALDQASDD